MIKILRNNSILLLILLITVLIINVILLTKLNDLEQYVEQTSKTISSIDAINIYYVQNKKEVQETNIEKENETSSTNLNYSEEEINKICRVVEAETHGADAESKIHIVHVILNRVNSSSFPNSIIEVCDQSNQFTSRNDVEQSTIDAVYTALSMTDTTQGALFFHSSNLTDTFCGAKYLFTDAVGHHFYR